MTKYHTYPLSDQQSAQSGSYYGGSTDGGEITVWYDRRKRSWHWCISGISNGLYFETDDFDDFKSKQEALSDARAYAEME